MAKKSRQRVGRYGKDQSGCMWSLINIFDFRQGRSSQKMLQDRKRGSKRVTGAAYSEINLESLSASCEICKEVNDAMQGGTSTIATSKLSVKELMEEEMCGEQDKKRIDSTANGDTKQTLAVDEGPGKKIHRRTRSKASLDLDTYASVAAKDLVAQKPSHRKHKSASSVDLNVMVEELCSQIPHNDIGCLHHGQDDDTVIQSTEDPSVLEEKLWEATKVLVRHFAKGKSLPKDGKIQPSKELVDALQILDSNKEVFLKLLQDPNSEFVKHIRSLQDIQIEEGKFKVLTGSDLLDQHLGNGKQPSFFWRRFKGLERNSSKKSGTSEVLNRIVVLKPGPPGSRNIDMTSTCGSLPESPRSLSDNGQIERVSSTFSFSEFKKKLKHAIRKEQHGIIDNGMAHQTLDNQPKLANRDKKVGGETVGMASPSRDHFFLERIPKSIVGVRKVDKTGKPKDGKMNLDHDTVLSPEQRVSSIYAEAKKHLAEIVGNSDVDVDTLGGQVPKPLGRILSYSGYSSPSICSPRTEEMMRLSSDGKGRADDKTCQAQENMVTLPGQVNQELKDNQCIVAESIIQETDVPAVEPRISDGLPCESSVDKPSYELEFPTSEADADIVRSSDAEPQKESCLVDISSDSCPEQLLNSTEPLDSSLNLKNSENWLSPSSRQDMDDENEPSSSHSASTLTCSITKNEDVDAMSDATSRPSPVSVLEPIFKEDDISPPVVKSLNAVEPIQPRQINFEEQISTYSEVPCNRTSVDSDKYTVEFVKAVVQMSGLTWDELLRRSLLSDHIIEPSLLDEVDFLPDLLSCDFNLLFDLIIEVLTEMCQLDFSCMLSFTKSFVQPELKGKDIFTEIWKGVDWYLKLDGAPRTLDQTVAQDLAKAKAWMDLRPDSESVGILVQQAILEELVDDTVLCCVILPAEAEEGEITTEL